MSKIRSKDTGIEIVILKELKSRSLKDFVRYAELPGKPDFVFRKQHIAVFCDGDFWHGYKFGSWNRKLNKFWRTKITSNITRDRKNRVMLRKAGWKVLRLWGHEIKKNPSKCVDWIEAIMG